MHIAHLLIVCSLTALALTPLGLMGLGMAAPWLARISAMIAEPFRFALIGGDASEVEGEPAGQALNASLLHSLRHEAGHHRRGAARKI